MRQPEQPKTLHLLIKSQWLVDSITSLGSGYLIHLVYQNSEIAPDLCAEIKEGRFQEGVLGEIIHFKPGMKRRVAMVEIDKVNDFQNFIRFDLRILEVVPFLRDGIGDADQGYLCYYYGNPG
ncbi:hypothetical protein EDC14_1002128 [Hydrogenispora ethanolica]|jgi:hypothetical protein|uniref:Uncharacterized protein n=1 Tax=Hydrogenispora ethanolica TaxID=1082276 RepID=A0A4R1SAI4_HYDET|nr:hypothetical protein [Hydrogenispora ethanolica]TCL76369.1 hypothetical protein EDC14_1002128 [Hydrogenispora ethanolica]